MTHTLWEDGRTIFDLREGAGFIYQVRIDRNALKDKQRSYEIKKEIKKAI